MEKANLALETIEITQTLGSRVYSEVRKAILRGEFSPGEFLHEDYLVKLTGASRTPIREALLHLQRDGLIDVIPRKGARICQLEEKALNDLVNMRILIESSFFDRPMIHDGVLAELSVVHNEMKRLFATMKMQKGHFDKWLEARVEYAQQGFRFHRCLVKAVKNDSLLEAYDILMGRIQLHFNHAMVKDKSFFNSCALDHEEILRAIQEHHFKIAKELLVCHVRKMINYSFFLPSCHENELTLSRGNEID